MTSNEFMGYLLTNDESEALYSLLLEMRKAKRQSQLRAHCKAAISSQIDEAINKVGLDETKRIVRELNRELREDATN